MEDLEKQDFVDEENVQLAENAYVDDVTSSISPSPAERRELLKKTKIVKQTWSIIEIFQKIRSNKLDLSPDYQRNEIWDKHKMTAFIESLFIGIIVPPIYVVEIPGDDMLDESKYEVVDGKQRLTTIQKFLLGEISLYPKALEYYEDCYGNKKYSEIKSDYPEATSQMLSSVLDIYVITANSPEFTKYDIFSRLNKGSEKLKVNEIRKAIYRSEVLVKIDDFVKSFLQEKDSDEYKRYTAVFTDKEIRRYDDYGRFYSSVAFYLRSDVKQGVVEGYNSRPRDMINNVLHSIQTKEIQINGTDLSLFLCRTFELLEMATKSEYKDHIVYSCVPFVLSNWETLISKFADILKDEEVLKTLVKSPGTTSNVNDRLKRINVILNS